MLQCLSIQAPVSVEVLQHSSSVEVGGRVGRLRGDDAGGGAVRLADAAHDGLHLGPTAERERIQAGAISDTMEGLFIKLAISAVLSPNLEKG